MRGFCSSRLASSPSFYFYDDVVKWEIEHAVPNLSEPYKLFFTSSDHRTDYWWIGSCPCKIFFDDGTDIYFDDGDEKKLSSFLKNYIKNNGYEPFKSFEIYDGPDCLEI